MFLQIFCPYHRLCCFLGTGLPFPPQLLRKVHSLPLQGEDLGLTEVHCCPLGIVYLNFRWVAKCSSQHFMTSAGAHLLIISLYRFIYPILLSHISFAYSFVVVVVLFHFHPFFNSHNKFFLNLFPSPFPSHYVRFCPSPLFFGLFIPFFFSRAFPLGYNLGPLHPSQY